MDTQDILDEAEEILHAYPTADGRIILSKTPLPKGTAHVPPAVPVVVAVIVALVLPLASIIGQLLWLFHPPIAAILVQAQAITGLAHVYTLPPVTLTQSKTVVASGQGHVKASYGRGLVTFYNGAPNAQTIAAGELLTGNDGQEVVTDQDVTIPAGSLTTNGFATVSAHALDYGPAGNIAAGDIYGPCCRAWVKVVNAQFTGGHAARDYAVVTQSDIATAVSNLQTQENLLVNERILSGETLITPVPCTTQTTSNHRAGDVASQVTVIVRQDCHPTAYKLQAIQSSLIRLVVGKTKQDALYALQHLPGVRSASISWAWGDAKLPRDAKYINLILLVP